MRVSVVVGNPKPKSRTLHAGLLAARKLAGAEPDLVLDLADLGGGLLEWGNEAVTEIDLSIAAIRLCYRCESDIQGHLYGAVETLSGPNPCKRSERYRWIADHARGRTGACACA